jgi:polysaccharide biosynthesis/export protein
MHKLTLLSLFIFSSLLVSQSLDLDTSFLESLPDDIKSDLENKIEEENQNEEAVFSSINSSTDIEKRKLDELNKKLEKLDEYEQNESESFELTLFGKNFFSTYQSTFMPVNEPYLDSSYVLDYGDILEIQIIGQNNSIEEYKIKRDGSILFNNIGKINLAGLSLSDASKLIKEKVNNAFFGSEAFVSLINVRDIRVLVSGNAFNPGIYTIGGNSNLLHAISVAGGINEYGSYRQIKLIRKNEVVDVLDLYDILLTGNYSSNKRLRSGDIVFVENVNNIISIDGAVRRPAKYEVLENQNLFEVVKYAGLEISDADLDNIFLDRQLDGKVKSLPIGNLKQFKEITANDKDSIFIRKIPFREVYIDGAILKPGIYKMTEGEDIFDLLKKSGGFTQNAYPLGAIYENLQAFEINESANKLLYNQFLENIILISQKNISQNSSDLSSLLSITKQLKNTDPNGRIVVDISTQDNENTVYLKDGDKLFIPEKIDHIYIYGETSTEGAIKYKEFATVNDYLEKAGGIKSTADESSIFVLHPNGETERYKTKKNIFANNNNQEVVIYPGSIIFVPRELDESNLNALKAQAYVSILGNLGIALASIATLNNN